MKVVHGVEGLERSLGRLFVVIGVFDGLHRGHLYLLEKLREAADARAARAAVITFDHHPDEVITVTVVQTFDVALRMTPFDTFVRQIADRIDLAGFLMTPESAFGHDRAGTPDTVAALGRELGYETVVVPPYLLDGEPVSSGAIRRAIATGDLATAERLLGRPVSLHGDLRTATARGPGELELSMPMALPPAGSYRVMADPGGPAILDVSGDGRLWIEGGASPTTGLRVRFEGVT